MFKQAVVTIALMILVSETCAAQHRPESFGVVVGSGQPEAVRAANYTAMKACIESAMAANQPIVLPAGTIEIDVPNRGSLEASALRITGNLKITGDGLRSTILKFGPESPAYRYSAFYVGPRTDVYFKNFTIEGPADPGPNGEFNAGTCGIRQVGSSSGPSGTINDNPGRIRLKKVALAGEFYTGIMGDHGDVSLELTKCDITAYVQCVAWFASSNTGKSLLANSTYFHDAGLGADLEDPVKGHLVYLSPCVSFDINKCRFGGNFRYAIHHYGSSVLSPKFVRLSNSEFEASCADGIETTNTGFTEIISCTFDNKRRGVSLKGNTSIQDSTFNCSTGVTTYDNHSEVRVDITHCKFNSPAVAVITSVWPDSVWNISDCDFTGRGSGSIGVANGASGTQITLANCRFSGDWKRGIYAAAGSYLLSNSDFDGSYSEAAVTYDDTAGVIGQMVVNNCRFNNAGRSIWAVNGASGKLTGDNNYFTGRQPNAKAGMYQRLQFRKASSPENLASADTLTPNFNYHSYRVTGDSRINNVKLGGSDEITRMCAGRLQLVARGAWSLADTGNIRPLSTGARVKGEIVTLTHDPQTGIWVEVAN